MAKAICRYCGRDRSDHHWACSFDVTMNSALQNLGIDLLGTQAAALAKFDELRGPTPLLVFLRSVRHLGPMRIHKLWVRLGLPELPKPRHCATCTCHK